jgi:hypothetical protein
VPAGREWKSAARHIFARHIFFPPAHFFITRRSGFILPRLEFLNLDALNALKKALGARTSSKIAVKMIKYGQYA